MVIHIVLIVAIRTVVEVVSIAVVVHPEVDIRVVPQRIVVV